MRKAIRRMKRLRGIYVRMEVNRASEADKSYHLRCWKWGSSEYMLLLAKKLKDAGAL